MKSILYVYVLLSLLVSCNFKQNTELSTAAGFPSLSSAWLSSEIEVCWERSAMSFGHERDWVEEIVTSQFNLRTNINLVEWNSCPDINNSRMFRGIRIGVDDSGPHTKGLGRRLAGFPEGMVLNFEFENWSSSCKRDRKRCIESIAVHEFGHALGLAHEQNRLDTPATCEQNSQGSNGDTIVGEWDLSSVMNYCNPVYNNNGILTTSDIEAVNLMYRS